MNKNCPICKNIRLIIVCAVSGLIAAYLASQFIEGQNATMLATFFGALLPLLLSQKNKG